MAVLSVVPKAHSWVDMTAVVMAEKTVCSKAAYLGETMGEMLVVMWENVMA